MLLGIFLTQVWHWATYTKKERKIIRIIVVSLSSSYLLSYTAKSSADLIIVLGTTLVNRVEYLCILLV